MKQKSTSETLTLKEKEELLRKQINELQEQLKQVESEKDYQAKIAEFEAKREELKQKQELEGNAFQEHQKELLKAFKDEQKREKITFEEEQTIKLQNFQEELSVKLSNFYEQQQSELACLDSTEIDALQQDLSQTTPIEEVVPQTSKPMTMQQQEQSLQQQVAPKQDLVKSADMLLNFGKAIVARFDGSTTGKEEDTQNSQLYTSIMSKRVNYVKQILGEEVDEAVSAEALIGNSPQLAQLGETVLKSDCQGGAKLAILDITRVINPSGQYNHHAIFKALDSTNPVKLTFHLQGVTHNYTSNVTFGNLLPIKIDTEGGFSREDVTKWSASSILKPVLEKAKCNGQVTIKTSTQAEKNLIANQEDTYKEAAQALSFELLSSAGEEITDAYEFTLPNYSLIGDVLDINVTEASS